MKQEQNMTNRRKFLGLLLGTTALVGCTTSDGRIGLPINVTLPPEVTQIVSDAESIIAQGKKFLSNPTTMGLIGEAEGLVSNLRSGNGTFKSIVGALAPILGTIGGFLPPPYNIAASVLVAATNAFIGKPITARLPMTPEAARQVMAS